MVDALSSLVPMNQLPVAALKASLPTKTEVSQLQEKGISNGAMERELEKLGKMLSQLQNIIAQFEKLSEQGHGQIDQALVNAAHNATNQALSNLKALEAQEAAQASESLWEKIVSDIITAVTFVFAAATGQWELFAITLVFTIMSQTGGMAQLQKALVKLLQDIPGLKNDPLLANLLADTLIIVATVLISHGVGSGLSKVGELCSTAAKASREVGVIGEESGDIEMTTMGNSSEEAASEGAQPAATSSTESAEETTSPSLARRAFNRIKNIGSGLSKRAATNLLVGSQAVMNTNFASDLALEIVSHLNCSKKEKQEIEDAIEALVAIIAVIAGVASMNGLMSGIGKSAEVAGGLGRNAGSFSRLARRAQTFLDTSSPNFVKARVVVLKLANLITDLALFMKSGTSIAQGATDTQLAKLEHKSGAIQASLEIFNEILRMVDSEYSESLKSGFGAMKNINAEIAGLGSAFSGVNEAAARELAV